MRTHEIFGAIEAGDAERVRALADADPAVALVRDEDGVSAVLQARYYGRTDMVDALLADHPGLDLFEAAAVGRVERVRELLDHDPARGCTWSPDGFTALHLAAFFGHPDVVELLLALEVDVDPPSRNALRVTPLQSAAASNETAVARRLLDAGADANVRSNGGFTPLHAAAQNGNAELVRLLLERGADAAVATDDGQTARGLAAGKLDVLAFLS
ncbi:MAG: ankyrin repeat domain-containing protein [Gaiellaceae bacterium]